MHQPGVTVRPIRQLTGTSEFNEVFFDGARTAAAHVVGQPGDGWRVAKATLALERGAAMLGLQVGFRRDLENLIAAARESGAAADPLLRDKLARAWIGLEAVRAYALDTLGGDDPTQASVLKILWSRWHQRLGELAMEILGAESMVAQNDDDDWQRLFLFTRAETIYGGSDEIQRNIIATRALGLPRTHERPPPARGQGRRDHRRGRHRHRRRHRPPLPGGRRPGRDQRPAPPAPGRHPRRTSPGPRRPGSVPALRRHRRGAGSALIEAAAAHFGRIDVLVNNAGLGGTASVLDMTDEQWFRVLDVTLTGTFRCTRAALRQMVAQGHGGAVVNNASVLGWRAQPGQAHYAAAKAGVMALTRCAALDVAPHGIRVNAVAPSLAIHPFLAKVTSEALLADLASREAFGRAAEPREVANVIVFLASDYASYMTGEVISVSSQHP